MDPSLQVSFYKPVLQRRFSSSSFLSSSLLFVQWHCQKQMGKCSGDRSADFIAENVVNSLLFFLF